MGQNPRNGDPVEEWDIDDTPSHPATRRTPPAPTINPERRLFVQELVRAAFAGILFLILLVTILVAFSRAQNWDQVREVLEIFVPVIGTALGAVGAFYYADRRKDS